MKTIKTLAQAKKLVGDTQLNAQDLIRGQIYIKPKGWTKIKLSHECRLELANHISSILGGRNNTKIRVFNNILYNSPVHWGLERIIINRRTNQQDKRKKTLHVSYCAGQDYTWETNEIRTALK